MSNYLVNTQTHSSLSMMYRVRFGSHVKLQKSTSGHEQFINVFVNLVGYISPDIAKFSCILDEVSLYIKNIILYLFFYLSSLLITPVQMGTTLKF